MRRVSSMSWLVLVAAVALVAASGTNAARGGDIKFKAELIPCLPDGEGQAEGEAEWEQERDGRTDVSRVKIEIAGIPELAGQELEVVVEFVEGDIRRPFVVGSIFVGPDGRGSIQATPSRVDLDGREERHVVVGAPPVFASDSDDCD
jgi:hypothetical protein